MTGGTDNLPSDASRVTPLDEFIQSALIAIAKGISEGQRNKNFGEYVAPLIQGKRRNEQGNFHLKGEPASQATIVQFDVQVTTEVKREAKVNAGAKIRLMVVEAELRGAGDGARRMGTAQRLQFSIPLKLPSVGVVSGTRGG